MNALVEVKENPGQAGAATLYVEQDANWNVTALVNSSGTVVQRFMYSPFGVQTLLTPTWGSSASSAGIAYGFQGERYDSVSKLYYCDARDYSPALQRWIEQDPAQADLSTYRFVGNRPTDATDPEGLQAQGLCSPKQKTVSI